MGCEIPADRFASGLKIRGMEHDVRAIVIRGNGINLEGKTLRYRLLIIRFSHEVLRVVLTMDHSDLIDRLLAFTIPHTQDLISIL
ncbi:MAG: hypothetical protein AMJ88_09600 [Anaerolineae bacterium SM23_ 63]|nr:MAG: hypothetical protein AMJ88_09600 [Anaerolineae bacterium SM23_ 63]